MGNEDLVSSSMFSCSSFLKVSLFWVCLGFLGNVSVAAVERMSIRMFDLVAMSVLSVWFPCSAWSTKFVKFSRVSLVSKSLI